ncbi:MAG: CCE_0567 family metalloprotein [Sulfurovaceae bacterium]|jgi:hypothetical protein|nr:CCE_0567 family metalloprotein [Sulfurovaceae bacterium]MDD5548903.1 CCE_0567 family metalloprotein [Sulfurovaceae bacterium]
MEQEIDEKEIKKIFAGAKRKVVEVAGEIHDIVEDTIWVDYDKLPILSKKIQEAMVEVTQMREKYEFLK